MYLKAVTIGIKKFPASYILSSATYCSSKQEVITVVFRSLVPEEIVNTSPY
jgi:hypothetical protein